MAKFYFYYSAMNAGKSTHLLQSAHNYQERGMDTLIFTPALDDRYGQGKVQSRIGLSTVAIPFDEKFNLFDYIKAAKESNSKIQCVFVDEAQFLAKAQVTQLAAIVDKLNIPVLAYGLRSDFRGEAFEGSKYLLIWADNLVEIKTICHCGKKAIMNVRIDEHGNAIKHGEQVLIGGNSKYIAMCRRHFIEAQEK